MIVTIASAVSTIERSTIAWSSSAALAFRGGGVGAGVGAGDIHMDITAMATPTATVMGTHTVTDTVTNLGTILIITVAQAAAARLTDPTIPPIPGSPSCSAGLHGLGITMAPSMESWGLEREKQFERMSATTGTQADRLIDSFSQRPAEIQADDPLSGFFSGVLVAAAGGGFAAVSFGAVDFSPAVGVGGDSFLAASLYESLR